MTMEYIKTTRVKVNKKSRISMALFRCSYCDNIVERTLASKNYKSCGCFQHKHDGCKSRNVNMEKNPRWNGGRNIDKDGYILIKDRNHNSCNSNGYVREHVLICENVLGRKLSKQNMIHHIDFNKSNNTNNNLVICENDEYHKLLHLRTNSLINTGFKDRYRCSSCNEYKKESEYYISNTVPFYYRRCKECAAKDNLKRKRIRENGIKTYNNAICR